MSWLAALLVTLVAGCVIASLVAHYRHHPVERRDSPQSTVETVNRESLALEILAAHRRHQRRMSTDLHDGVSQNLAGISLLLGSFAGRLRQSTPDASLETGTVEKLDRITEMVNNTSRMAEERVLFHSVDQEIPGDTLHSSLAHLAKNIETFFAVDSRVVGELPQQVIGDHAGYLYRIAEEAAYNAVRHGRPTCVSFELRHEAGDGYLHIDDDGCGITDSRDPKGRGIQLMTLRCAKIKAHLDVGPRNSGGTRITCRWPLHDDLDREAT